MRIESWVGVMSTCLLLFTSAAVADEKKPHCTRSTTLPSNVELTSDLGRIVQRMYDRSSTFRSQCHRIARATNLHVRVQVTVFLPRRCRAFTVVRRSGYRLRADVSLPPGAALTEMLAHEFEHVVEQIEGLDLRRLARIRGSGVHEVERELFESDRAQDAGRIVAAEVLFGASSRVAD